MTDVTITLPAEPWHDDTHWKTARVAVEYRVRIPQDWELDRLQVSRSLSPPPMHYSTGTPSSAGGQGTYRCHDVPEPPLLTYRFDVRPEWTSTDIQESTGILAVTPGTPRLAASGDADANVWATLADVCEALALERTKHARTRQRLAATEAAIEKADDRDPNVLARKLADTLDDLATERAAHKATQGALDAVNDHRLVLGVVADAARALVRELRSAGTTLYAASVLEAALDTLDMEATQ